MQKLNLETWKRKAAFDLFRAYANPFFNVTADVDVTDFKQYTDGHNISFFAASLYASIHAANQIEEFKYRIRGDDVVIHPKIDLGSTVLNKDETFSFAYFDYRPDFKVFSEHVSENLEEVRRRGGVFDPRDDRDDLIHCSVVPWISFRSISHASRHDQANSVPKIVLGKFFTREGRLNMPLSVEVHHALMDGFHVGQYFELLQSLLNTPSELLS